MTCIVAIKDGDRVYMGADSLGSNGHIKQVREDMKIFKPKPDMALGYTSSYRMGQLLEYSDGLYDDVYTHKDVVTKFIPRIRELFTNNGYSVKYNDGQEKGGTFLLAIKDQVFVIHDDFQVSITEVNYSTCGCGDELALGSLFTTSSMNLSTEERIIKALESAENFSTGVQRPFHIMNTYDNEVLTIK